MLKYLFIVDRSYRKLDINPLLNNNLKVFILTNNIDVTKSNYSFLKNVSYHKFDRHKRNIHLMNFMMYILKTDKNFALNDVHTHELMLVDTEYEYQIYEPDVKFPKAKNLFYFGNKPKNDIKIMWFDRIMDFFYFSLFESYCESFPTNRIPANCDFELSFLIETFAFRANIRYEQYEKREYCY